MFSKLKLRRRLKQIGTSVDVQYILSVNNEPEMSFRSKGQLLTYLKNFRQENVIFNLSIHRVEIYSL